MSHQVNIMPPGRRRKRSVGQTASIALIALLKVKAFIGETLFIKTYKVFSNDGSYKLLAGCNELRDN